MPLIFIFIYIDIQDIYRYSSYYKFRYMKNYLEFERDIKDLEEELEKLKDPYNKEGLSQVETDKIRLEKGDINLTDLAQSEASLAGATAELIVAQNYRHAIFPTSNHNHFSIW